METTATIVTALDLDMNGSSGNDVLTSGAGNDRIFGGAGSDTMDGGAGSDLLNGGSGADTLIYRLSENSGATDTYMGGSGKDTLVIKLTAAEWALYQGRIAEHLTHIAAVTNAQTGEVSNGLASDFIYRFGSSTLTVQMMEKLQVYVDGIKFLDSTDKTPTSTNDTAVVIEDTAKILGVGDFGTFSDGDVGDSLKAVQITVLPVNGSLTLAGVAVTAGQVISVADITANKLVYTPAANDDTNEALSFKVMDQADVVSVAYTLTLAITPVNDASVLAAAGTLAYTENQAPTAINTGLTISDVDSTQLTGAVVSITGNFQAGQDVLGFTNQNGISGSYDAATGVLSLTGTASLANYQTALRSITYSNSSDNPSTSARTVSFQVDDGGGVNNLSNVATAGVTVSAVNDAPTTTPVTLAAIAEDSGVRVITQAQLLSNASDVEGNALTASNLAITGGGLGSLVNNGDGTWNYTPALNDDSAVSFSYTITDNGTTNGVSDPKSVAGSATLDITSVNDAPTTTPVTLAAIAEDSGVRLITQAQLLVNASDVEANSLVASNLAITAGGLGSLVNNGDGTWNYTPALNDDTAVSFSYTITDNGTTNGVSDPKSAAGSATLDITPVNDAPTTTPVTLAAIAEDSGVRVITQAQLLGNASDVEGNTLVASNLAITGGGLGSLVNNGDGTWNYTPALNDDTSVAFSYTITDNGTTNGVSDPKSVAGSATLDITPVNDAPTTTPVTLAAIAEDSGVRVITQAQLLGNASDVEGNALVASNLAITGGGLGSLVNNGDGTWNYTPALNDDTAVSFSYTITDNGTTNGVSDPKSVAGSATLDITPVNDAPTTTPVTLAAIAEDSGVRLITQAQLLSNASDVEGNTLVASNLAITGGGLGSLVNNGDGTWNYTPALNDDSSVAFSYTITDNGTTNGVSDPKSVAGSATLDITPVNDAPTTTPVTLAAIAEDSGVRVITQAQLLGNASDVEGNALVGSNLAITGGGLGSLVNNGDGTWNYTPALNDDSSVSFSYTITDNGTTNGLADPKSVAGSATLDITPVNDVPTTTPVTLAAIAEDSGVRVITQAQLLGNASDVEGNTLVASALAITGGGLGSLVNNGDGTWNYTPALNDDSSVSFSYTITDNGTTNGTSDPKSVAGSATLDITPVNDAPNIQVAGTDSAAKTLTETNAGLTSTGTLSVTDADPLDSVASSVTGVVLSGTTGSLTAAAVQGFLTVSPTTGLAADPGASQNLTWNFSSGTEAFNYLALGRSLTLAYTVQSSDGNGGTDTQQVSITINGTADGPTAIVLTGVPPGGVIGGNNVPSGTIGQFSAIGAVGGVSYSTTLVEKTLAGVVQSDATPDVTVSVSGLLTAVAGANGFEAGRIYELNVTATDSGGSLAELFRVVTGTTGADSITLGSTVDDLALLIGDNDTIFAGAGDDTIYGQNGNDLIHGGEGNDTLYGMNGNDTFYFDTALDAATNVDSIFDFNANSADLLSLSSAQFAGISASGGVLAAADFQQVNTGGTGDVTGLSVGAAVNVVFDSSTGKLFYDANGGTLVDAVQFAVLIGVTGTFDNNDIIVG